VIGAVFYTLRSFTHFSSGWWFFVCIPRSIPSMVRNAW